MLLTIPATMLKIRTEVSGFKSNEVKSRSSPKIHGLLKYSTTIRVSKRKERKDGASNIKNYAPRLVVKQNYLIKMQ